MSSLTASKILRVNVANDKLTAALTLNGDAVTKVLTAEEIIQEIKHLDIRIDKAGIKNIEKFAAAMVQERVPEAAVIARGQAPIPDKNGQLKKLFDDPAEHSEQPDDAAPNDQSKPTDDQGAHEVDGKSHYERSSIVTVKAQQKFMLVVPPETGTDGTDVYGQPIPRKLGREVSFRLGSNVERKEDHLVATCAGRLEIVSEKISVNTKLEIPGNVDFSVGNIDFPGEVIIAKNVLDLFKVHSDSTVVVKGLIEAAEVHAGEDLYGTGGMAGKEKGVFSADRDIHAKYITNATVQAGNDVSVRVEIVNCDLQCKGRVIIEAGALIGGHTMAAGGADLKDLGSEAGVKTLLEVGMDAELRAKCDEVAPAIKKARRQAEKTRQIVEPLLANQKHLNAEQKEKATELLYNSYELEDSVKGMLEDLKSVYEASLERAHEEIIIAGTIFPGVTIRFPKATVTIRHSYCGPLKIVPQKAKGQLKIVAIDANTGSVHDLKASPVNEEFWETLNKLLAPPKPEEKS